MRPINSDMAQLSDLEYDGESAAGSVLTLSFSEPVDYTVDMSDISFELVVHVRPVSAQTAVAAERQVVDHRRVQQIAQLLLTEQIPQHVAVEGERLGAALGHRGIALVQVGGGVGEDQRAREGRSLAGLDLVHALTRTAPVRWARPLILGADEVELREGEELPGPVSERLWDLGEPIRVEGLKLGDRDELRVQCEESVRKLRARAYDRIRAQGFPTPPDVD